MPFQSASFNRFTRGSVLAGLPDDVPPDAMRYGLNVRTDSTLARVTHRPGMSVLTGAAAAAALPFVWKLYGSSVDYSFYQSASTLYRLTDAWATPSAIATPGTQVVSAANATDGVGDAQWALLVNGTIASKDNGASTLTLGIAPPTAAPSATALASDLSTTINLMNSAAQWTGVGLASGPTDEATILQEGAGSVLFTIAASTLGSITRSHGSTLDLDTLSGGDATVKADDYIHLWVRVDRPERLEYMQLDFDLDGTSFAANYYSARIPIVSRFNLGRDQWSKIQVRKSEFQRFGSSADDWGDVEGYRISFLTNALGTATIYVDDLKLRGGCGIEGDMEYTVCYRNSSTGGRGNPPKDADRVVLFTTKLLVDRQRVTVTLSNVAQGGANHPGDTQIDQMMLWRRGGAFENPQHVANFVDTTTSYTDSIADATLVLNPKVLETDNDVPPTGTSRIIFGPDAQGHYFMLVDGIRLYFSKPYEDLECRFDNWPYEQFALIGDGSQKAVGGIATDTEVAVGTESQSYQLIGSGPETFLPVPVPNSREWVSRFGVTQGAGALYFLANDGIYVQRGGQQQKLTSTIDPFFGGLTVDGAFAPMSTTTSARALSVLQFHPDPHGDALHLLYAASGSSTLNASLTLKRGPQGELTEAFFGSSALTTLRSLYLDTEDNQLLAGAANGNVYKIEDYSVSTDAGTAITVQYRSASVDLEAPQRRKKLATVSLEGSGAGHTVRVYYNRAGSNETLGTFSATAVGTPTHFTAADPQARWTDFALDVSGSGALLLARYSCTFALAPEPATYLDSDILNFPVVMQLKLLEFELYAPSANVTVSVYTGGTLRDTRLILASSQQRLVRHYVPSSLKGHTWRIILESSSQFEVWQAAAFFKPLGSVTGFQPQALTFAA